MYPKQLETLMTSWFAQGGVTPFTTVWGAPFHVAIPSARAASSIFGDVARAAARCESSELVSADASTATWRVGSIIWPRLLAGFSSAGWPPAKPAPTLRGWCRPTTRSIWVACPSRGALLPWSPRLDGPSSARATACASKCCDMRSPWAPCQPWASLAAWGCVAPIHTAGSLSSRRTIMCVCLQITC